MSGTSTPVSKSGITEGANGEAFIPSSKRADGSVRKEIRVRPGYKPPEDVEVYKNRTAAAFNSRGKGGIPGADFVQPRKPNPPKKSPAKKSGEAAIKRAEAAEDAKVKKAPEPEPEPEDPEVTKQKEARKLSKKLRQARDLQKKKEEGAGILPEQFQKVIQINELIRQLDKLGFDQEGQKKPEG